MRPVSKPASLSCISLTASALRTKSTRSRCSPKTTCAPSSTWIVSSNIGSVRFLPTIPCCAAPHKIPTSTFRRAEPAHETVDYLNQKGEKVGLLKVRLYRPFSVQRFLEALPPTVRQIAVLDRTKEAGAGREPLYLDVVSAIHEGIRLGYGRLKVAPEIIGGRYGLSSKEFTPAMVKAVYDNLAKPSPKIKDHFTVGIQDDVSHSSLDYDSDFSVEPESVVRAMFYGLGADGTVGANKNSIKIIGENTDNYGQGYFVYDSKKSGAMTVSHLRFGPQPIRSSYLVSKANFVACHQWIFLERYDMLGPLVPGGVFLLNSPFNKDEVWDHLPRE